MVTKRFVIVWKGVDTLMLETRMTVGLESGSRPVTSSFYQLGFTIDSP